MKHKLTFIFLSVVAAICLCVGLVACGGNGQGGEQGGSEQGGSAVTVEKTAGTEGLAYTLSDDGTYYICSGIGTATETEIEIASWYQEKWVIAIGSSAFDGCSALTSVTVPDSVTSIGDRAFDGCSALTSVTVPDSVTSIGDRAFRGTAYYNNENNWENGVLYIGKHLIQAKTSISGTYEIRSGTLTVANYAFCDCTSLTSITIPDSVTSIGEYAFRTCISITNITIPDSVTSIGEYAFNDTAYFSNDSNWENGVLYIGKHLMRAKTSISGTYEIRSGTLTVANHAFSGCTSLTSITVPNSVTSIGTGAFLGCTSLTSVTIGNGVTSIGIDAFRYCTSLTIVTIGNGVTSIGIDAFYDCSSLTSITFQGTIEQWNQIVISPWWNSGTGNYTVHCTDGDITK